MNPEAVFQLLVDANPLPEGGYSSDDAVAATTEFPSPYDGSEQMQTPTIHPREPEVGAEPIKPRSWGPTIGVLAAAVVVAAVTVGVFVARGDDDSTPTETDAADQVRIDAAVATAEAFYATVTAGDVDAVIAMSNEDVTNLVADRNMWEGQTVHLARAPWTVGDCAAGLTTPEFVEVGCEATMDDPVWETLGLSQLVAPVRVYDDGTTAWQPFEGGDFTRAHRAYAEYLRAFHPAEYEAVCAATAYEPFTVGNVGGLALSEACAELWVPLGDDVAQWVEDGRPLP